MVTTSQYKPLQDPGRYVPLLATLDPEAEREVAAQVAIPGHLPPGLCQRSEMFSLPRPLWSPLNRTTADYSAAPQGDIDPRDSIFHAPDTMYVPSQGHSRAPTPVSDASGAAPTSVLSHPEFWGIRGRVTTRSPRAREAISSVYKHPARSVSADSSPLLREASPGRPVLGSSRVFSAERGSRGKSQSSSPLENPTPSKKAPPGSSLIPPEGRQAAIIRNYLPARQYSPPRIPSSLGYTLSKRSDDIDMAMGLHYQAAFNWLLDPLHVTSKSSNFQASNRNPAFLPTGFASFPSGKLWAFSIFGRPSAFDYSTPLKADFSVPLAGSSIESFIHPRYRSFVHQFLCKSVLKPVERTSDPVKEILCDPEKGDIPSEDDASPQPVLEEVEQTIQPNELDQSLVAPSRKNSVVAMTKEPVIKVNLSEVVTMFERSVVEDENRVVELDMDEDGAPEEESQSHRRVNPFGDATHQGISALRPSHRSETELVLFASEAATRTSAKRRYSLNEESSQQTLYERIRNSSAEANIEITLSLILPKFGIEANTPEQLGLADVNSPGKDLISIPPKLSINTDASEQLELANVFSPGKHLIFPSINTTSVRIDERSIPDPLLFNPTLDSAPGTPTSMTCSVARWSTQSVHSTATGVTVPYSFTSPSSSRKLLTEKAWDAEEELHVRGRQERRTHGESRLLSVSRDRYKRSQSIGVIDSERPIEFGVERTQRRSVSTNTMSTRSKPMLQQPIIMSPIEPENLDIEYSDGGSSGSASIVRSGELEDPFISDPQIPQSKGLLFALEERGEIEEHWGEKEHAQRKDGVIKRLSQLGHAKPLKAYAFDAEEATKKRKFQRFKDRVKGLTRKVSSAIKK